MIVVVELNKGLKKEISGKNGEDRRSCRVAGTGYIPASKKNAKLAIAPESAKSPHFRKTGTDRKLYYSPSFPGRPFTEVLYDAARTSRDRCVLRPGRSA